jgi:hypothetical protein
VLQQRKAAEIDALLAEGRRRIGTLSDRDLLIAGTALYAGEGAKTGGMVAFPNSDPRMVLLFCAWFRRFFQPDEARMRVRLYLHDGLDLDAASAFWADVTQIPLDQFQRPYRAVADPTIRRAKHPMGCPAVRYTCTRTQRAVLGLVEALLTSNLDLPG